MVKLVIHVGHGKTGSTSIQQSLEAARDRLAAQGVQYLGLMLEHAATAERPRWQVQTGSNAFFQDTPPEEANAQLLRVLGDEADRLAAAGIRTAIWSNEWLFTRSRWVLGALLALQDRGLEIEVQCYVRRHDEWAQSAYAQWGLKHKSYEGPVRDFASWLETFGDRQFRFAPALAAWDGAFGPAFKVFNFDAAADVVHHFLNRNGLGELPTVKDNISPDRTLMVTQAVYNGRRRAQVPPHAFNAIRTLLERHDQNNATLPPLDQLAPSAEALQQLVQERRDDIERIDALLRRTGEPPLSFERPPRPARHPSSWEMDQLMLKLIFALSEELVQLRRQVAGLREQVGGTSPGAQE
ncbi:hypothetical protein [Rhodobacter sp. CZR27]|uniref:hypothetical protein n=1 Tax=Rhodobacter sp. CZR27 TaxID=2033869 RepID=UPI000BBF2FD8|nr:hypothetical protein [Rhodobacter sp. CZR27]